MPITLPPVTRRRFMAGTLGGAVSLLFHPVWGAESETPSQDVWAILSDTHIPGDRNQSGGNPAVKPVEHLSKVRSDILSGDIGRPCGLIVSGDCVYLHGLPDDYKTLLEEFEPFRQKGLPVHFVMGNHDNRQAFLNTVRNTVAQSTDKSISSTDKNIPPTGENIPQQIPSRLHSIIETPKVNFFLLDSLDKTNHTPGFFGEEQLQWLTDELDSRKDKPAILVAHHNPDYSGNIVKAPGALQDTNAFFERIRDRQQVKAYFYGHTHTWKTLRVSGIHMVNIPATAWRFDQQQPFAWVLLTLKDNGMSLTLRSIDPEHSKHNEIIDLSWR
ncbi:MAG: metallophosphoesterase [Planctomycetaceae bacterium]|jgi:3',5'-cyclic AMP phosphodiesterase CpdA|nr:metallophosphoesterase [Planctomycetaceae bacterium]